MTRFPFICCISLLGVACAPVYTVQLNSTAIPINRLFLYQQSSVSTTVIEMAGQPTKTVVQSIITDLSYQMTGMSATGNSQWESTMLRYQAEKTANGDSTTYFDSAQMLEEDEVKKAVFGALNKAVFQFDLSTDGTISHFSGMEAVWQKVAEGLPPNSQAAFKKAIEPFSDAAFVDMIRNGWDFYPTKSIKKGAKWQRIKQVKWFNAQKNAEYELWDIQPDYAFIQVETATQAIPSDSLGESLSIGGAKITYHLDGSGSGSIKADRRFGLPLETIMEETVSGTMEINVPFLAVQKIPVRMTNKTILKRMDH